MKMNISTSYPLLIYGDHNLEVEKLQRLLKKRGLYKGDITGIYAEETLKAVVAFKVNLNMRDNSVVTSVVWKALSLEI